MKSFWSPSFRWRNAAGQLLNECRQGVRGVLRRSSTPRRDDAAAARILAEIRTTGFCVVPDFLSADRCRDLIARIDDALSRHRPFVMRDAVDSDERLYGLDAIDGEVRRAAFDPWAIGILQEYERATNYNGFALCARMRARPHNPGSGGGWHRDSAAYMQTKCMIYLSDVTPANGPFQFVAGSHRLLDVVRSAGRYGFGVNQHRFSDAEIAPLLADNASRVRTVTGKAGAAVLFDSRGIHRGMPIETGTRYAITSYLWFHHGVPEHIRAWTIESQQRHGARGETSPSAY